MQKSDTNKYPEFYIPTIAQVRARLVQAGFHLLLGENISSDNRIVIQAQK